MYGTLFAIVFVLWVLMQARLQNPPSRSALRKKAWNERLSFEVEQERRRRNGR